MPVKKPRHVPADAGSIFETIATAPITASKRDAFLAAASQVFMLFGYQGVRRDLIAEVAGAARRTLYNQFPEGKRQLFRGVTDRVWRAFPAMDVAMDEEALASPEIGLRRIGHGVASFWRPPLAIAFIRIVIGESRRFLGLMKSFFDAGKTTAVAAVRAYMAELGKRGILQISDPRLAARQFLELINESVR